MLKFIIFFPLIIFSKSIFTLLKKYNNYSYYFLLNYILIIIIYIHYIKKKYMHNIMWKDFKRYL